MGEPDRLPLAYEQWRTAYLAAGGTFKPHTFTQREAARKAYAEWRHLILAQHLPNRMFSTSSRKYYLMKEVLMLQPRGPRLLVKRLEAPKPESSLIEIPDTIEQQESVYALVLAVGNKVTEAINVADTVILAHYSGSPVEVDLDGEKIDALIVMENDVLAVVED